MAGVVPSSLHHLMKFVWDDNEVLIHSESRYPNDEIEALVKKVVDWELAKLIPHLYQYFIMKEYGNDDGLGENLFEEYDVVLEENRDIWHSR